MYVDARKAPSQRTKAIVEGFRNSLHDTLTLAATTESDDLLHTGHLNAGQKSD